MDRTITLPIPDKRERKMILIYSTMTTMHGDLVDLVDWKKVSKKTRWKQENIRNLMTIKRILFFREMGQLT
jgi:ATP-dependent 26S proteasome regulatory subunit